MQLDADYLDIQQRTRRERWRLRLTALALVACVVMLGDLVASAQPLQTRDSPPILCPDDTKQPGPHDWRAHPFLANADRDPAFNLADRTLCSGENQNNVRTP